MTGVDCTQPLCLERMENLFGEKQVLKDCYIASWKRIVRWIELLVHAYTLLIYWC